MAGEALIGVYRRYPVAFVRGEGVHLWDDQGKHYWDFLAGIGASSLGHHHPRIRAALTESASLLHTSNLYRIGPQEALADRLSALSGGMQAFFANSGAEANEAAIKLARRWGRERGRTTIVSFHHGFHGRTLGALAATGEAAYREPFEPLPAGFRQVPYDDLAALREVLAEEPVAAVLVEVIQGEAGVVVPRPGFLPAVAEATRAAGALLIIDEVQTGMGRTGYWFGWQHEGVVPDVMTLAKGLGGGVPIGAMLARPEVAEALRPGDHGSTFGGNFLATRVGLAVVDWLQTEGLDHVRAVAPKLEATLTGLARRHPERVEGVRGRGLMWGLVLNRPSAPYAARALEEGLVINAAGGRVLRLLPPLVVDVEAIGAMGEILDRVLAQDLL
ncbi:MAG: aspartate aminotransferase family protein [Firmicutes bacterium]|nr:aspartate aminotransferase family protein [Alicyclobacillaceae bacterium]MCL6498038.1 aspartate aminotransferase family protein [Bacillota bacterium]